MIREITIKEIIYELNKKIKTNRDISKISIAFGKQDDFFYEHGELLYLLVGKYKPKKILEIGTGGGFSSLFMMWAIKDFNLNCEIFTVDRYPINRPHNKIINNQIVKTTVNDTWDELGPESWESIVHSMTGHSSEVFAKEKFPKFDMIFIDGGHDYETVRHDFFSVLELLEKDFVILLDDYIERPFYGVKKFVDEQIIPYFDTCIIKTGEISIDQKEKRMHARCLIDSTSLKKSINEIYPKEKCFPIIEKYRKNKKIVNTYRKYVDKIPLLKNKRIKFWKSM